MNSLQERITIEPGMAGGRPCIRGLRVRVQDVLEMLGSGMTTGEILAEYPYLEPGDVDAARAYAAVTSSRSTAVS